MVAIFTGLGAGFAHGSATNLGSSGLLGSAAFGRAGEGVSVNAETGNLVLTQQDEFLTGVGPDVSIARTYNSVVTLNENNDGWRQSTDRRLILSGTANTGGSTVTQVLADGATVLWTWNGSAYTAPGAASTTDLVAEDQTLTYSASSWTWRDNRGHLTETYGSDGYITTRADDDGNKLTYTYLSTGKLDKIITQDGTPSTNSYVQYLWNGNDITDVVTHYVTGVGATLTRTHYEYDTSQAQHRLKKVTVDLTPEDNSTADGKVYTTTYTYEGTSNRISTITQSDGSVLTIGYTNMLDGAANPDPNALLRVGSLTVTVTGSTDTRTTSFAYFSDHVEITDPRSQVTKVFFAVSSSGLMGDLTKIMAPPTAVGATAQTTLYAYDAAGHLTQVTDALGKNTTYVRDPVTGNVTSITDPNGVVTTNSYDANNNLILVTVTGSNAASASASLYTRYVYDSRNHLTFSISAEGRVTENSYTSAGLLKYQFDYPDSVYPTGSAVPALSAMNTWRSAQDRTNSEITEFSYDTRGNLAAIDKYSASTATGGALSTEGRSPTTFTYDQAGRLLAQKTGPENQIVYIYDGLGRLIAQTDMTGATTAFVFDDANDITKVITLASYNASTKAWEASPQSYVTVSTYDKAGELLTQATSGGNVTDGSTVTGGTSTFLYDKNGQVRKITDATGRVSYIIYDKAGRKIADVGQNGETIEYRYDADGRVIFTVRYANKLTQAQITTLDNPNSEFDFGSSGFLRPANANDIWQWTIYDAGGRISETIEGNGAVATYDYDSANRLIRTTEYAKKLDVGQVGAILATMPTAQVLPVADSTRDRVTRTFYDGDGNVIGTLNGEGALTQIDYDSAGRKTREITYANLTILADRAAASFNTLKADLTADATKDVSTRYVYDGQGLLRYSIDSFKHVTEYVYRNGTDGYAIGVVRETIVYAAPINVTTFTYGVVKAALNAPGANDRVTYSVYNDKGQLAYSVDPTGAVTAFAYDTAGRVITTTQFAALVSMTGTPGMGIDSEWKGKLDTWAATPANAANARISYNYYSARGDLLYSIDAEGDVTGFDYDAEGRVTTQYRYSTKLTVPPATAKAVKDANKGTAVSTSYLYDSFGRVTDITDGAGTVTHKTYYATGTLATEVVGYNQTGTRTTTYTYNTAGMLTKSSQLLDPVVGTTLDTSYIYDGLGNVITKTDARGNATTYTYDKVGREASEIDPLTGTITFKYDAIGRNVRTIDARGNSSYATYDQAGRVLTQTDAMSGVVTFEYDPQGRGVKKTDARGNTSFVYFDAFGRVTLTIDEGGYATQTAYNAFGEVASSRRYYTAIDTTGLTAAAQPTLIVNASVDAATFYAYDKVGRVTITVGPELNTTSTAYDAFGNVQSVRHYVNKFNLYLPYNDDTNDAITTFEYDNAGRLKKTTDALGNVETYTYDAAGNRTHVVNKLGGDTTYVYDTIGRVVEERLPISAYANGGAQIVNKFEYDANGNLTKKTEAFGRPEQRTTSYAYDKLNRVISKTGDLISIHATATSAETTPAAAPVELYTYDANGNLIQKTDALGGKTLYWYDALGRLTTQVSPLGTLTRMFYDANGDVTDTRVYTTLLSPLPADATGVAPTGGTDTYRSTQHTYDKLGRQLTTTIPSIKTSLYTYYLGVGEYISTGDITTETLQYDSFGNVVKTIYPYGASKTSYYDRVGNKIAEIDADNYRTDWTYDTNGNVLTETRYANVASAPGTDPTPAAPPTADATNDRITIFAYDKLGQRVSETRKNVAVYDNSGGSVNADSVVAYTYNGLGEVLTKTEATGDVFDYYYDASGRMIKEQRPTFGDYTATIGAPHTVTPTVEYTYDGLGDVTKVRQGDVTAVATADRVTTYVYGAGGMLTSMSQAVDAATNITHNYYYDAAGRLTVDAYTRSGGSEATGTDYDAEGRVIQQGTMALSNGTTKQYQRSGDQTVTQYNAFGDVAKRGMNDAFSNASATVETFDYDGAGRLWRTNSGDGTWKYFMYDAVGNQTLMITSGGTNIDNLSIDQVLALWPTTGKIGTDYVNGVVATITMYDGRHQATLVREPQRETSVGVRTDFTTTRGYNAFGETAYEINANGARVDYTYNTMGRLTKIQNPPIEAVGENGQWITGYVGTTPNATSSTATTFRPIELRYYDAAGRMIAARDANGNLTKNFLLKGTGYDGAEALITQTNNADGGHTQTGYDVYGNARTVKDADWDASAPTLHIDTQTFDRLGRLIKLGHSALPDDTQGLVDYYQYDELGQRTAHWNSFLGASKKELTSFDIQGRVTSETAFGGDVTNYSYAWSNALATAGMATFGGWTKTTTLVSANNRTMTEVSDVFDHAISKTDFGGTTATFTYDKAGRLVTKAGGQAVTYTYLNTNRLASEYAIVSATGGAHSNTKTESTTFGYDNVGNLLRETMTMFDLQWRFIGGVWEDDNTTRNYENATATYDALNHLKTWSEAGSVDTPASSIGISYDANGNVRRNYVKYRNLSQYGVAATSDTVQDYWYKYDAMNRVTVSEGAFSGSSISRGTGMDVGYDFAGNRIFTLTTSSQQFYSNQYGGYQFSIATTHREDYFYDAANRLSQVRVGDTQITPHYDAYGNFDPFNTIFVEPTRDSSVLQNTWSYDLMGRMINVDGHTYEYNDKSQLTKDTFTYNDYYANKTKQVVNTYDYGSGAGYYLGAQVSMTTVTSQKPIGSGTYSLLTSTSLSNSYNWADGPIQSGTVYDSDTVNPNNALWASTFSYSAVGGGQQLNKVHIEDGRPRDVLYVTDVRGQIVNRFEYDTTSYGDPKTISYRFGGLLIGTVANDGLTTIATADFNQGLATGQGPGQAPHEGAQAATITARDGDTLSSVAAQIWGDASLWYKLAEANGLQSDVSLTEGQVLRLPTGVVRSTYNADTFTPYDPAAAIGNTSPTAPTPPKKHHNCGVLGQVLLAVIAIVVTIYTAGVASAGFGSLGSTFSAGMSALGGGSVAASVAGGVVGSIASQAVGVATGIQDKFSWNAVALAGIGAGITSGVAGTFNLGAVGNAVVGNALTQGVAVATGLQQQFSWAGVAAAGVGAAVGNIKGLRGDTFGKIATRIAADDIADAATRSLIDGSDFGDNALAALPSIIGQTIGNAIAGGIAQGARQREIDRLMTATPDERVSAYESRLRNAGLSEDDIEQQVAIVRRANSAIIETPLPALPTDGSAYVPPPELSIADDALVRAGMAARWMGDEAAAHPIAARSLEVSLDALSFAYAPATTIATSLILGSGVGERINDGLQWVAGKVSDSYAERGFGSETSANAGVGAAALGGLAAMAFGTKAVSAFVKVASGVFGDIASRLATSFSESQMSRRVGTFLTDESGTAFGPPRRGMEIPQGVGPRTFDILSGQVRAAVGDMGLGDDIFVMGSRSAGTAEAASDFDFGVRVPPDRFDELIGESFGNPNPGSALERTRDVAIRDGRIQTGEAGLRDVRTMISRTLNVPQSKVQISVIRAGGAFDNGPQTPLGFGF